MDEIENILDDISSYEEFEIWLNNGIDRGWITEPFCNTHEGDPFMTDEESEEWEAGGDPCCHVVRLMIS